MQLVSVHIVINLSMYSTCGILSFGDLYLILNILRMKVCGVKLLVHVNEGSSHLVAFQKAAQNPTVQWTHCDGFWQLLR